MYSIVQQLHHVNIIRVFNVTMTSISMERLNGLTLDKLKPNKSEFKRIHAQIRNGLDYLHNFGMIHCDIRPINIFITKANIVKIIDFDSVVPRNADINLTCDIYRNNNKIATPRYDLYSLSVINTLYSQ